MPSTIKKIKKHTYSEHAVYSKKYLEEERKRNKKSERSKSEIIMKLKVTLYVTK